MGDRPTCPFVALGIEHGADEAAAKRAHRALMLAGAHPDRGGDPGRAQELGGALQLIAEGRAYGRGGCDCSGSRSRYQRNGASAWETGFDPFAGTRYRNTRPEPRQRRHPDDPRRQGESWDSYADRIQQAYRQARTEEDRRWYGARTREAASESVNEEEREQARERARQRQAAAAQNFRAARERHAPPRESEPVKGGAYHRPGKPIYQPGAANPPKSVKDLFGKKPAASDDEEIPF